MSTWTPAGILNHYVEKYCDPTLATHLRSSKIALLLVSYPFIAESPAKERYAAAYIALMINAAQNRELFATREGETIHERMMSLAKLPNPQKPQVVVKARALLHLASLVDHARDKDKDKKEGRYNPLNDKVRYSTDFYQRERARLAAIIDSIVCPEIDAIVTHEELTPDRFLW